MYHKTRDEEVKFMKQLWQGKAEICPVCRQAELVHFHKKRKKSNNDWKCPACGEVYRLIKLLYDLPD